MGKVEPRHQRLSYDDRIWRPAPRFEIFLATFNQTYGLIPSAARDGVVAITAVTFDKAVMEAEKEEQQMKHLEEPKAAYIGTGAKENPDQTILKVPHCTHCRKNYHTATECWDFHPELKKQAAEKKRRLNGNNNRSKRQKPATDEQDEFNFGGASVHMMASTFTDLRNLWALDTGCTQHLSHWRQDFINMKPYTGSAIQGIGGTTIQPKGVGTVKLGCNIRGRRVIMLLSDTLFCPTASINLISVSQLMPKRGVNITFHATSAKIQTPGRTFLANMHRGLYILNLWSNQHRDKTAHASYSITDPTLHLWHKRMGHLGEQNVKRLQDMSTGMTRPVKATPCTECLLGRMKEKSHNTPSRRGEYPLEYIHIDIAGPFPIAGYNGCQYWVTLDDATQLSTVIPITTKSKMFDELRKFLSMYKRPERRCHRIRLDDSGENRSHEFRQWCAQQGIAVEVTTTEQHQ